MNILAAASPALKRLFERVGKPRIHNLPDLLKPGGTGAVIVCNHTGWADGLWMGYAVYPRPLRHLSKQELFASSLTRWVMEQSGSIAIDRTDPSPSSIKTAIELLHRGEIMLVFPSGTRSKESGKFKRGAATIALHAQVPIVPAYYDGPEHMRVAHLIGRPHVNVTFGDIIATAGRPIDRHSATLITRQIEDEIEALKSAFDGRLHAA